MKISVLISVCDRDDPLHFRRALESIWDDQSLQPDEIVLVEDGPLNRTLEGEIRCFKKRASDKLKNVKLLKNSGLAKALNEGIKECSGDLIARMDSDDISAPDRFKLQHEFFCRKPNTDLLGGALQEFNEENDCLFIRYYPENTEKAKCLIAKGSPFAHPAVMFHRRVFDQGYRYKETYRTSQDIDLWFRLLANGFAFSNISDVLIFFRVNQNFAQRRSKAKAFGEFKIYWYGVLEIFGWNWRLIYPVLRLAFRLGPKTLVKKFYINKFRKYLNSH